MNCLFYRKSFHLCSIYFGAVWPRVVQFQKRYTHTICRTLWFQEKIVFRISKIWYYPNIYLQVMQIPKFFFLYNLKIGCFGSIYYICISHSFSNKLLIALEFILEIHVNTLTVWLNKLIKCRSILREDNSLFKYCFL